MYACSANVAADANCLEQIQGLASRLVRVTANWRMRPYYVGWVCTPETDVASVETSWPHTMRFLEGWV